MGTPRRFSRTADDVKNNEEFFSAFKEATQCESGGRTIGFKIKICPSKDDTGVDESITKLAAAVSGQIYAAKKAEDFDLSTEDLDVEVIFYEDHDSLNLVIPPFVAVRTGNTMILGWQGTSTTMNFVTDVHIPPASSLRWNGISKDIKVQGGFYSNVENDLANHEADLVKFMEDNNITEVITTGHSLGGGMAQVGQVCIRGEIEREGSVWKTYADKLASNGKELKVKTVAFSAPMSIVNMANAQDTKVKNFLKKIESNSCNIIYSTDPVPRGYGYLSFIDAIAKELIPQVLDEMIDEKVPLPVLWLSNVFDAQHKAEDKAEGIYDNITKSLGDITDVCLKFRHYCKIISYDNDIATPMILKDYGHDELGSPDNIKNFRDLKWQETPDVIGNIKHNHLMTVRGPGLGYNIPESYIEAKLYHMHKRAMLKDKNDVGRVEVNGWDDCRKKAKEHLVSASMGGVVVWDEKIEDNKDPEGKGILYIKKDVPKLSKHADFEKDAGGILWKEDLKCSILWRTPALSDKDTTSTTEKNKDKK